MPLSAALPLLQLDIWLALEDARKSIPEAAETGTSPSDINKALGDALGMAIHSYTTSAVVQTTVITVLAGIAAPLAPAGACPVAGAGMGSGTGTLL